MRKMLPVYRRINHKIRKKIIHSKHSLFLKDHPKIFCNSFHKSGTQLLVTATSGIPGIHHYDVGIFHHFLTKNHVNEKKRTTVINTKNNLSSILPGELRGGHVEYHKDFEETIKKENLKLILIVRDPRDVIVSTLKWWNYKNDIDTWAFRFFKALNTFEEKINFLIQGHDYPGIKDLNNQKKLYFPNIVERYNTFLPWLSSPFCLTKKFENLKSSPYSEFKDIYEWVWENKDFNNAYFKKMMRRAAPKNSKTFIESKIRKWQEYFNKYHYDSFEKLGGKNLLTELNYKQ